MDSKAAAPSPAPVSPEKSPSTLPNLDDLESLKRILTGATSEAHAETPEPPPPVAGDKTEPVAQPEEPTKATEPEAEPKAEAEALSQTEDAETEAAPDPEADADDDNASPAEDKEDGTRKKLLKRIDKLTERAKTAEEDLEAERERARELQAKVEAIQAAPPPPGMNRFANITDERKLDEEAAKARNLKRWCEDNADGAEVDGKPFTPEQIRQFKRAAEDALDVDLPQRREFLRQYNAIHPQAVQEFSYLRDRKSEEYALAEQLRTVPFIASRPDQDYLIAAYIEGVKVIKARREAAKAPPSPKPAPKPAPKQPAAPTAAPTKVDPKSASYEAAKAKAFKSGDDTAIAEFLKHF